MNLLLKQILSICALVLITQGFSGCESGSPAAITHSTETILQQAQTAYDGKQFANAQYLVNKALNKEPDNRKIKQLLAQIYFAQFKPGAAIAVLETIEIKTTTTLLLLAQSYLATDQAASALQILNQINQGQKSSATSLLLEAQANLELGDVTRTDDLLKNLLDTVSEPETLSKIELLQSQLHKLRNAIDDEEIALVRSVQLYPKNLDAIMALAAIETHKENFDTAEDLYSQVLFQLSQSPNITPLRTQAFDQLSQLLAATGRTKEAIVYARLIAENNLAAQDVEAQLQSALVATENKSYEDATEILLELYNGKKIKRLDLSPQGSSVEITPFQRYQNASFWRQYTALILETLDQHLTESPRDSRLLGLKQITLLCQDKNQTDTADNVQTTQNTGMGAELEYSLAMHHLRHGEDAIALKRLQSALKKYSNSSLIMQALLDHYKNLGKEKDSESLAKRLAQHQSPDARLLAALFYLTRDAEISRQLTKSTTSENSNSDTVVATQLVQSVHDGNHNDVVQFATKLLASEPNNLFALRSLISAVTETQGGKEAKLYLRHHKEQHPEAWSSPYLKAQDYYDSGQTNLAINEIETALKLSHHHPAVSQLARTLYHSKAEQALSQHRFADAREWGLKGIQFAPDDDSLIYLFTSIELANDNLLQAKNIADAFKVKDTYIEHLMNADISRAENKIEDAMAHYLNAWQQNPNDELSRLIVRLTQDQPDGEMKVEAFLGRWIETVPSSHSAHTLKAINLQKQGQLRAALDSYDKSLSLQPDQPFALNNMAWILNEQGRLRKAAAYAKRAFDLSPENPFVLDTYGWILYQLDDVDTAKQVLEKAASLAPDNDEIQTHLDAISQSDQG